jgi:CheY-like chemotaxis protein
VITVSDNGIGISDEMLSAIFNMFTQVDYSLERAQAGLGVGLTLARHLVELHDGTIEAHSDGLGRGSRFVVRLPLAAHIAADPVIQPPTHTHSQHSAGAHRILVVDDNVDFALSLKSLLESLGNEVAVAHDGPQALDVVTTFETDFAFLDVGLPGLNGYELVQRLRTQPNASKAVCIAVTGWGQDKDRQRSRDAGFDYHLTKPVELADVEAILRAESPKSWRSHSGPVVRAP